MNLNKPWRAMLDHAAALGIRLGRRSPRLSFDPRVLKGWLGNRYESLYANRRRVFGANFLSGMLIAFSVFFLGQTGLYDMTVDFLIRLLLTVKLVMMERRLTPMPLLPTVASFVMVVAAAALVCTHVRSMGAVVVLNTSLCAAIIGINFFLPSPFPLPLGTVPVVLLITLGAAIDWLLERRLLRRRSALSAERQETGFTILRHIAHSVNPTIQMALAPLRDVRDYLEARHQAQDVIGTRRDGSVERVEDALAATELGLRQIREILDTTEDLFGNRIEERDFEEVDLRELFTREVIPLFPNSRFAIRTEFTGVRTVRLHRPSFVQAVKNLIRNAEVHGFPPGFEREGGLWVNFSVSRTVKEIVIDYENNGLPFPKGLRTGDFLAFGTKGKGSPGKGLGGAWVAKFIEIHNGTFTKLSNDPVRFRMTLPRRQVT
ncbi:MAG: sensor histidine kinase [Desulfuromonadales bacterium]|nr:MAG: sensor histidine kinase [Desulfuromonadales bacterium]